MAYIAMHLLFKILIVVYIVCWHLQHESREQEFIIYRNERVSSSQYTPYKITVLLPEILYGKIAVFIQHIKQQVMIGLWRP